MKKKYARTKLIIIALFAIIGLCLTVFAINIPGTSDKFLSLIGAMDTSTELGQSYKVVFTVDRSEGNAENSDINEGVQQMYDIFTDYISNYNDVKITRATSKGEEQIVAYVPSNSLGESFFTIFGERKEFEGKSGEAVVLTNKNIKTAQYLKDENGSYGIYIEFDKEGTSALIKYEDNLVYTLGGESATARIINNMLFINTSEISSSASAASSMVISLMAGKLPFSLTVSTNTTIDALAGGNVVTLLKITTGVMALAYVVYMIVTHRLLGLTTLLGAGIFVFVDCFILQSIPVASLQLASYMGIIISFIIYALANEYMLNKMKKQYAIGKRLPVSIKQGYKDSLLTLMDLHITMFIIALSVLVLSSTIVKAVCMNLIVGIFISALLTMVVNKYFIKLLCDLYPTSNKKFNFTREETVDEI